MLTADIVQLIVNKRQRKREIVTTLVFVCAGHRNFFTNDQVTSQRFNSKHMKLCNLTFNQVEFLTNYNCTKSKGLNYSYNCTKLCN